MPLRRLPTALRERIQENINKDPSLIDLSDYPLDELSDREFQALVEFLVKHQTLQDLRLKNCQLAGVDRVDLLYENLAYFTALHSLDLSFNKLGVNGMAVELIFKSLSQLPNLRRLYFWERHWKHHWQHCVPEVFDGLKTLALVRYFKKEADPSFYFLNTTEVNALIEGMRTDWQMAKYYLDRDETSKSTFHNELIKKHPIIGELEGNRKQTFMAPTVLMRMRHFIDQLEVPGLSLDFGCFVIDKQSREEIVLNIEQGSAASFEHLAIALIDAFPAFERQPFFWTLILPSYAISHWAIDLCKELKEKYHEHLIIEPTKPAIFEKIITLPNVPEAENLQEDYKKLTAIARTFIDKKRFYAMTQTRESLFACVAQLERLLNHEVAEIQYFTYEFFIAYSLCNISKIKNLEDLRKIFTNLKSADVQIQNEAQQSLSKLKKAIESLLHSDKKAVTPRLDSNQVLPPNQRYATRLTQLQAYAWWGIIAYHEASSNAISGMYWYGQYLNEYPLSERRVLKEPYYQYALLEAKKSGVYWLRRAATQHKHPQAIEYLMARMKELSVTEGVFPPADRYQYMQFCDFFKAPNNQLTLENHKPQASKNLVALFPAVTGLISSPEEHILYCEKLFMLTVLSLCNSPQSVEDFFLFMIRGTDIIVQPTDYPAKPHLLRVTRFYLYSLIADDLIGEPAKVNYLQQLSDNRVANAARLESPLLKEEHKIIQRFQHTPLARHLHFRLLPLIRQHVNGNQRTSLDNAIAMNRHPEELRIKVFCELFNKQLNEYLKTNLLFKAPIKKQENPSYIAVLLHCLITEALDYFMLNETEFAKQIDTSLQAIKEELREHSLHQQLSQPPLSFGFNEALAKRLNSYSAAANLSNLTDLSLLSEFGAVTPEPEPESWTHRILPAAAFIVEGLHLVLPFVLAITGYGLPLAAGSAVAIAGLRELLHGIHHAAHVIHEILEFQNLGNTIVGLAHLSHLAHEAFHSHDAHTKPPVVERKVLRHLNELLTHAGANQVDAVQTLIHHFAAVYKPITTELCQQSNTILGILLVELFLRGLKVRLSVEQLENPRLPTNLPELYAYFTETLWLYSCPRGNDDVQLITKNHQTFSALTVIFPSAMQIMAESETRQVALARQFQQPLFYKPCPIIRYASTYEVKQINLLRRNELPLCPFRLANNEHKVATGQPFIVYKEAYQEAQSLADEFSLKQNKKDLKRLTKEVEQCDSFYRLMLIKKKQLSTEEKQTMKRFSVAVLNLKILLAEALKQPVESEFSLSDFLRRELEQLGMLEGQDVPQAIIQRYIEKAQAFLILMNDKYRLALYTITKLPLAKKSKADLILLLGEEGRYFLSSSDIADSNRQSIAVSAKALLTSSIYRPTQKTDKHNRPNLRQLLSGNPAVSLFYGKGASDYSDFNTWYHPEICHYLLQMSINQAQCLRVMFNDASSGNNTGTFKSQLQTLIGLANKLDKPAIFISKEPGADNHFICGLIRANNLLLINPLGITKYKDVYKTLGELQQEKIVNNIGLSNTVLQKREYEENGLVSCGPLSVELAMHILNHLTLEQMHQFWDNLTTNKLVSHTAYSLRYFIVPIIELLPKNLQQLNLVTTETAYIEQIKTIRQQQGEALLMLATYRAKAANTRVDDYLKDCKNAAPAQVVYDALHTQHHSIVTINEIPEYTVLTSELSVPEQQITASQKKPTTYENEEDALEDGVVFAKSSLTLN